MLIWIYQENLEKSYISAWIDLRHLESDLDPISGNRINLLGTTLPPWVFCFPLGALYTYPDIRNSATEEREGSELQGCETYGLPDLSFTTLGGILLEELCAHD